MSKKTVIEQMIKIKPMFNVGEWVVNKFGDSWHIDSFDNKNYQVSNGKGHYNYFPIAKQDEMRHWSIKGAKDGDVLANDHHILILKELDYDWYSNGFPYSVHAYCGIKPNGNFELGKDNWCFCGTLHMRPATSEERDLLFAKMKEAGYKWDAERKELEKIELAKSESGEELSDFEAALFSAFSDGWQQYLHGEEVDVAQWAKEHSAELLEVAKQNK